MSKESRGRIPKTDKEIIYDDAITSAVGSIVNHFIEHGVGGKQLPLRDISTGEIVHLEKKVKNKKRSTKSKS